MSNPRAHDGSRLICLADPELSLVAECGLIDSGHDTYAIYQFCIDSDWLWYPSKGAFGLSMGGKLVEGREDFYEGTPILRYHYNDYALKTHFYGGKIKHAHNPNRKSPRLYMPDDIGDDFVIELTSESLQPKRISGGSKLMEWIHDKSIGPNDWGDAGKMQFALWQIMGPQIAARFPSATPAAPASSIVKPSLAEVLASLRGPLTNPR